MAVFTDRDESEVLCDPCKVAINIEAAVGVVRNREDDRE